MKEDFIEALSLIYARLTKLRIRKRAIETLTILRVDNQCPTLIGTICTSFAAEAYTTIFALLNTGTKSFDALVRCSENTKIKSAFNSTKASIYKKIPDLKKTRNKVFGHTNIAITEQQVDDMLLHFWDVTDLLVQLFKYICNELDLDQTTIPSYQYFKNEKEVIDKEIKYFCSVIEHGDDHMFQEQIKKIEESAQTNIPNPSISTPKDGGES